MPPILSAHQLSKSFGRVAAVQELSFEVNEGDIYGFLGQNGAGKSTTMRMMLGLIHPDAGTISIKGEPFNQRQRHLLQHVGAIIERPDLYGYLSSLDNLRIFARLSNVAFNNKSLHELLTLVGLKGREKDKVKTYSQGMKQRLGIAIALVHNPDILILDEPTNGLDPQGIVQMRNLIMELRDNQGKTIIISSHLLHEIEQIATSMLIMHEGRKIAGGRVTDLLHPSATLMEVRVAPDEAILRRIREDAEWSMFLQESTPGRLIFKMDPDHGPRLARWLVEQGADIYSMQTQHSLETYFLTLTEHAAAAN